MYYCVDVVDYGSYYEPDLHYKICDEETFEKCPMCGYCHTEHCSGQEYSWQELCDQFGIDKARGITYNNPWHFEEY